MPLLSRLKPLALPAASGVLLALAFPPFGFMLLAYIALVPILLAVRGLRFWQAFRKGYLFAIIFALPNMFWLEQFVAKWTGSVLFGMVPWLIVSLAFAVYFALFCGAAAKCWQLNWPWAIPLMWAGVEVFRSNVPYLFYPWSLLAAAPWKLPILLQPAHWGGPYFLSATICLFSVIGVMFLRKEEFSPRMVWYHVVAAALIIGVSAAAYVQPLTGRHRTFAAVQPGVDLAFTTQAEQYKGLKEKVPQALAIGAATKRDLLVLPEGISEWARTQPTAPFPLDFSSPVIMGGQRTGPDGVYQSMFAYDGKWQAADKVRLVIFGEYVPFRDKLSFLKGFNLPGGDLRPGERITTLTVDGMRVGGLLCFEALFEEVARQHAANGADVIAIMSLDDWYQHTGAIDALKGGAVLRAVENSLPVVRSASLGPSMIISARGDIAAESKPGETTTVQASVQSEPSKPWPTRNWFPWLALASWLAITFWPIRREMV